MRRLLISLCAVAVALAMREKGAADNDLLARLAGDDRLGLTRGELDRLVARPLSFTGAAVAQVATVVSRIEAVVARHPDAAAYAAEEIL